MSPSTVTIYHRETGVGRLVYRATLSEFLEQGDYTLEKPEHARPAEELKKSLLPTAGREANRPASEEIKAELEVKAVEKEEEEKKAEAAPKRAPRRRKTEDASPSSIED